MSELIQASQECCDECDDSSDLTKQSHSRQVGDAIKLRQSFEGQVEVEVQRSRDAEKDRTALRRFASEACCVTELDGRIFPIEHSQKNVTDRERLDVSEERASNSTATATVGEDEREMEEGLAGKCGVKRSTESARR